ncbi:MAG: hypothetical protein ACD_32C00152G0005 [uncultured bacterium]|uniref:Uncharacterized protein n=1 Tax=Candidatus Curtissbacteria bacterium GW2011_GWC2_38_9 TaxID=1618414 RepID=A0A0G0LFR1_9BACT|nr:MAG: hypothetical protein ACD_32C00152G0005 [uncultured bacterium]KKQ89907.1 MAG: hypothetical protein UT12_C0006G0015 [Candidatus Curtissbacteria bacterium GW2011_GWC2_38_9]OGE22438.1 MAG: hypothetical protein A2778_00060 [Candidatus Daviesbacteria bacterium RIFCSPHIGHO2_01_FULL_40_24]OGE43206.1 MAG: hypothetical protein A3A53_05870 [Candidatus Daviesbacteria bacterium RIFCSPLOWO2_01_FULL_39_23]OGE66084.1 MAG: hypothetical protein A3J16_00065 [Candidatus Daviesbacteria bacterium RIFCSPLOWO2
MKEILDKLSSYNLFNYLLPGTLFITIANKFTSYSLIDDNLIIAAFTYYFVGLVVSRFGSLIIEPTLIKISFLKFCNYKEFILACQKDPKIEILSESNNMYRTFISMLILLLLLKFYELIEFKFQFIKNWDPYILIGLLLFIFLYSYRKQTEYVAKRIKENS